MRWPFLLLLVGFLALATLYNLSVPFGEGPDEPGHLRYVLFLAREGRLPVQRVHPAVSDVPGEGHQPPLAYLSMTPAVAWLPPEVELAQTANPRFVWAGGDQPGAFMRGSWERDRTNPLALAWHLARGVSALWALLAVIGTYLAARAFYHLQMPQIVQLADNRRRTTDDRQTRHSDALFPVLAASFVALNPQFLFSSALVTNDTALAAFGALLLWLCLRAVARREAGSQVGAFALIGALFGLALLAKQSGLLLGPLLLWAGWRAANGNWRTALIHTLAWGIPALLVSGWWFVRNWLVYGDLFGLTVFTAEFAGQPFVWADPAAWRDALIQLFGSFWGRFGWMSLPASGWMIGLYALLCGGALLGLVGGLALGSGRRTTDDGQASRNRRSLAEGLIVLSGMALVWTIAFALTAGLVAWQGRMLFPAISALAILLALGMRAGLRRFGDTRWAAASVISLMLALALYAPLGVIRPAYPWAALTPAQAQAALGTPFYARFAEPWEQGVVLRGWRLDGPAAAGSELPLTLTWNSLAYIPKNWAVFLHLVDAEGNLAAVRDSDPLNGELPLTLWTPGDWIADPHTLNLPADLPPGRYTLRVGLFRAETDGRRSAVWAEDGALIGDAVTLGEVEVLQNEK
jgi:4-amino-4-deoxy-L-arabinose transferase-like glycosyltransferase